MSREGPLAGRVVLVTRPEGRGAKLRERLEALGARVETRPTIALEPPTDLERPRRALARLRGYRWLLFTSPSGVRFFFDLARNDLSGAPEFAGEVGAIGKGTAAALAERGWVASVVATDSRAEGLAAALGGRLLPGQRVLLVRPEEIRPVLPRALRATGARVDEIAFYRNVPAEGVADLARDVQRGLFDAAVFTSPSTLQRLLEAGARLDLDLRRPLRRMALVAIGEVTARALREARLPVSSVAREPSDEGIVQAVRRLFART